MVRNILQINIATLCRKGNIVSILNVSGSEEASNHETDN